MNRVEKIVETLVSKTQTTGSKMIIKFNNHLSKDVLINAEHHNID